MAMEKTMLTESVLPVEVIKKYGERSFMYTEYPNMRFWSKSIGNEEFRRICIERFQGRNKIPSMLYIHIPHCHTQCLFCTCHVVITRNYQHVKQYLTHLYKEIKAFADFFRKHGLKPIFTDVHFGGGSPTFLKELEWEELMTHLRTIVHFDDVVECSIEIDPRRVQPERMYHYAKMGINRVSFGVQDFDREVQKAINRVQPASLVERFLTPDIRALFTHGINFDIICGLPRQTEATMKDTMELVAKMAPDRICLNYLHYIPEFFPHQEMMPPCPNNQQRKALFLTALNVLSNNGYVRTGYDHFAKSTDEVVRAMTKKQMRWNRLGVAVDRYEDTIGIGVHGVSKISNWYFQNVYYGQDAGLGPYVSALEQGEFPIYRGHQLTGDDMIRRDVIHELRNYFSLLFADVEKKHPIEFEKYFQDEMLALQEYERDGIVLLSPAGIHITDLGCEFVDSVCSVFDLYVHRV